MNSATDPPKGHDMSRYWRLVSVENGRVTGTFWVDAPDKRGRRSVKAVDVTVWADDARTWGRAVTDLTAFLDGDGEVDIPPHMIREQVRDDVLAQIDAMKAACLAAVNAVEWEDEDDE